MGCRSGRTGRSRKPLYLNGYRRFESFSHRIILFLSPHGDRKRIELGGGENLFESSLFLKIFDFVRNSNPARVPCLSKSFHRKRLATNSNPESGFSHRSERSERGGRVSKLLCLRWDSKGAVICEFPEPVEGRRACRAGVARNFRQEIYL